ncbi:MAG TPA: hypothetical protein DDY82_00495 [Clostridiales bacterium]|nr:hypothetical protein [Clostridiales bacterium]
MYSLKDGFYLINLIKSVLNDTCAQEKPIDVSFENVYELACAHEVAGISFLGIQKLENKCDNELYEKWRNKYYLSLERDFEQTVAGDKIEQLLSENGYKHLSAQGREVKKYYPSPELRMMSDIDFIVQKEKLSEIKTLLLSNGYTLTDENQEEISVTDGINLIEIHTDFFYSQRTFQNGVKCLSVLNNPFKIALTNDNLTFFLDDTNLYLFNVLHLYKHFLSSGAGIRRIMDIYVLKRELKNVDYERIGILLDRAWLGETDKNITNLALSWFENSNSSVDENLAKTVFLSENHGSRQAVAIRRYKKEKDKRKPFAKIRYAFSRFFVDKKTCYKLYPFCKKHRYPLFLCWIHRFNCFIFHPKKSAQALKELSVKDDRENN